MRYSIIFAVPAFAVAAFAQESSSTDAGNPFTSFLVQTNSLGVVTGQPKPVTTQPSAVLSEPPVATVPAGTNSQSIPVLVSDTSLASAVKSVESVGSASVVSGSSSVAEKASKTATESTTTGSASGSSASAASTGGSTKSGSSSNAAATGFMEPALGLGVAAVVAALL